MYRVVVAQWLECVAFDVVNVVGCCGRTPVNFGGAGVNQHFLFVVGKCKSFDLFDGAIFGCGHIEQTDTVAPRGVVVRHDFGAVGVQRGIVFAIVHVVNGCRMFRLEVAACEGFEVRLRRILRIQHAAQCHDNHCKNSFCLHVFCFIFSVANIRIFFDV